MVGDELGDALRALLGAEKVTELRRLSGGASRETWAFDAVIGGSARRLILRRDPPGAPKSGMTLEARLFEVSAAAGVPVPEVLAGSDDPAVLGSAFLVMEHIEGETIPRKILRDDEFSSARGVLAAQCGEVLARLHAIDPDTVAGLEEHDQLGQFRAIFDGMGQPHPMFELAFRWLDDNRPVSGPRAIVHGDFRNGNLIVGPDGLRAVLDWELAHTGDPIEDLGWLCARPWRFGSDLPVGGFGTYDDLVNAYEATSGRPVDRDALHWWETLATLKWGVMCIIQTVTHTSGAVRSVELAAIGRRVCEVEWDLVKLLPLEFGSAPGPATRAVRNALAANGDRTGSLHDIPTASGLLEAVREFVERDVMAVTDGRVKFHARVAANVLGIVERELLAAGRPDSAYSESLQAAGYADDAEVAAAIRGGKTFGPDVLAAIRDAVEAKLLVANPTYLSRP